MKKIIIPVDFSKYSEYALKTAASIAKEHDVEITLITMIENASSFESAQLSPQEIFFSVKYAEKKIEKLLNEEYLKGLRISYIIKHYRVFDILGEYAKKHNTDLIIMGTHGTNSFKDFFMGSNTEIVVRTSEIPVLVVKNTMEYADFKKTVFVTHYKAEAILAYKKAMNIFEFLEVTPKLLFVNKFGDKFLSKAQIKERIETFLMAADGNLNNLKLFNTIEYKAVGKGTHKFADDNQLKLITIPTHGRTKLNKFFRKSATLDLSGKSAYPVLSIMMDA